MKVLILDILLEDLRSLEQASFYGLHEKETVIISSLKEKEGLKRIGIFQKTKQHLIKNCNEEIFTFYMKGDQILCIHNQDTKKPNDIFITEIIPYKTDFQSRNHGILDESVLQKKTVTIIGLGSGGSEIVEDLTRAGVTNFNLIDFDTVSLSNLCRSIYSLDQIGKRKTEAVLESILRINPCVKVQLYNEDALEMKTEILTKVIRSSDLIIEATDSVKSKIFINGIAYHSKPVLYPSVYDLGKGGDILFTLPGLPCYECVFSSIMDELKHTRSGEWDYSTGQAKPMPALISDIKVVAARTVKIALAILSADSEKSFIEKVTEPGCTMLFIGNEKGAFIFQRPFQEIWAETTINPGCACQTLA